MESGDENGAGEPRADVTPAPHAGGSVAMTVAPSGGAVAMTATPPWETGNRIGSAAPGAVAMTAAPPHGTGNRMAAQR
jgi:hypothetical protein